MDLLSTKGDSISTKDRNILLLFDVDGTLTLPRQDINDEMHSYLQSLKDKFTIGLVGGSDLNKISEQTLPPAMRSKIGLNMIEVCVNNYDYVFAENGLVAYQNGKLLGKQNLVQHLGEDKVQRFINFCLAYMAKLILPVKRGNFIEFRNGLINVCPVGRSCSQAEREQFAAYDNIHQIRKKFIDELEKHFGPKSDDYLKLEFVIGGQISFDVYPQGWNKTFCLNMIDLSKFESIHFFGDKTQPGGNDHAIFTDSRVIGHSVTDPTSTLVQLKNLCL